MRKVQVQADKNRAKRFSIWGILACVVFTVGTFFNTSCVQNATGQGKTKKILILYGISERSYENLNFLKTELRARISVPIDFYVGYMERGHVNDEKYQQELVSTLRRIYAGAKLDLVIVEYFPALEFAVKYRDELFPRVPIAFTMVDAGSVAGQKMWPGVTGVTAPLDLQRTLDLALRLHPDTDTVALIEGNSPYEHSWLTQVHAALLREGGKLKEAHFVDPPTSQLLKEIESLPPRTVVLFELVPEESNQPAINDYDAPAVASRFPTYCTPPILCVGAGGIGGVGFDGYEELSAAADIAKRLLSGERAENIPVRSGAAAQIKVDWRALQHWDISESALPAGSVILNRPSSFWGQYRRYGIAAAVVIAVLLLLIAWLLWERARKRKAEAVVRESEKRFRVMADTTPSLIWMCSANGKITYLNERRLAFTGPDPGAGYGETWITYVHPDDRKNVQDVFSHALEERQAFSNEYRLRRRDGAYRWMFDVASPRLNGDGSFAGFIGSAIDVTDHKVAQQALEKVSGQLIEAQENERRRIARDLHDDICQRLALLSMELDQANRSVNESADATKHRLKEIRQHCSEIAGDVQSLSHELHSSRLDYLGIVAAIRGFCHEFSKQHEVGIEFTDRDVPAELPREISLCLFRVAQEALHNAVKYSGVKEYRLELTATAKEIQLKVSDAGRGFDVAATRGNRGLGLVSMQERVHVIYGSLHVESEPGKGTRILAVVPLRAERQSSSENGSIEQPEAMTGAV